jgi:hypothetical protein
MHWLFTFAFSYERDTWYRSASEINTPKVSPACLARHIRTAAATTTTYVLNMLYKSNFFIVCYVGFSFVRVCDFCDIMLFRFLQLVIALLKQHANELRLNYYYCHYHYYYYYYSHHIHVGYWHLYTWNKPCFQVIQCCNNSAVTIRGTCTAIYRTECFVLLHQPLPKYVYSAQYGCFMYFQVWCAGIFWMILRWFQLLLLLFSHFTCAIFLL